MLERDISSMLDEKNQEELMELIINTFEKQLSKQPKLQYGAGEYTCSECECKLFKHYRYCHNCGQKLDWSEII